MMVEQSSSAVNNYQESSSYHPYPPPLATFDDVVTSPELFMDTLKKLHSSMGTKFMIPIVGGKCLDLYRLFVEVTSRGGIAKVLKDRRWKEVTAVFSFPSSATNASFILRKYYVSLLYHYEQIYFFKAKCWAPSPADAMQQLSTITAPSRGLPECVPSVMQQTVMASPQQNENATTSIPEGVIDGKFDSGYLVTVKIGSEEFKGVLYQVPNNEAQRDSSHLMNHSSLKPRRKRRKKSEIRKRDPAHPKPNRSGYNFFFAEQHARLKPLYQGKDREISRIIGESWNKLQEPERAVYQEKALKDKERYKIEMEEYRERLRSGQIIPSAGPIQQQPQENMTDLNSNVPFENDENEMSSNGSADDKDSDFGEYSQENMDLKNVDIEIMDDEAFNLQTRCDEKSVENEIVSTSNDGISVPIEQREQQQQPSNVNESV
ncbi:HMG box-containing protein [Handroanthus impetiginosus]|uniref:HMG box-containing protein n=1 Tax=Handroanthus impetiginosus TaxID=429701 RepID=A0A2G9HF82_9LAMI|nr:HMG box-containing protein [Handroanthus impetiginosus]